MFLTWVRSLRHTRHFSNNHAVFRHWLTTSAKTVPQGHSSFRRIETEMKAKQNWQQLQRTDTTTIKKKKNRKFLPVGTIPSNQTPFFSLSGKCELTAGSDEKKKTQRSPAGDWTGVFRLPVGRSNHWATKPRQEWSRQERIFDLNNPASFRWSLRVCRLKHPGHLIVKKNWQLGERQKFERSSCRGFVAQWLERTTGNRKTQVRSPAGLRCVFFRLIQLSVHICRIEKRKEFH